MICERLHLRQEGVVPEGHEVRVVLLPRPVLVHNLQQISGAHRGDAQRTPGPNDLRFHIAACGVGAVGEEKAHGAVFTLDHGGKVGISTGNAKFLRHRLETGDIHVADGMQCAAGNGRGQVLCVLIAQPAEADGADLYRFYTAPSLFVFFSTVRFTKKHKRAACAKERFAQNQTLQVWSRWTFCCAAASGVDRHRAHRLHRKRRSGDTDRGSGPLLRQLEDRKACPQDRPEKEIDAERYMCYNGRASEI